MEIVVHSHKYLFQQRFQKKLPFQQEFQIQKCYLKNDPIGHPESALDKTIRLQFPVLLTRWLPAYDIFVLLYWPKNNSFWLQKKTCTPQAKNFFFECNLLNWPIRLSR